MTASDATGGRTAGNEDGEPDGEGTTALIDELRAAHERLRDAEAEIETRGESAVGTVADAYRQAVRLLDGYEDAATGTGDFEAYVEFRGKFSTLVEELDEGLPRGEAFESADEIIDRRRLRERDFAAAREALEPAAAFVDLLERRDEARDRLRGVRARATDRKRDLESRIEELERIRRLGEAYAGASGSEPGSEDGDLEEEIAELRAPIAAYNEAIRADFASFRSSAGAEAFLSFVERAGSYPLVDYRAPSADLLSYVRERPAGAEPVPTLLEYEDYSNSKLQHYVDDPGALRTSVSVHRTYLEELDAGPLAVAWPPRPALELRYRVEELISVVGPIAGSETVARLRAVRALTREPDYGRRREAASARAELSETERDRLASGEVEAELTALRERRDRLVDALADAEE